MHLHLTRRSHLNSLYVNDDGQVLYKVETPFKFVGLVSTIKSVLPGDVPAPDSSKISDPAPPYEPINDNDVEGDDEEPDDDDADEELDEEDIELRYRFAHLAVIEYNKIATSVMRYRGEEYKTSKFFTKKEYGWFGWYAPFIYTGSIALIPFGPVKSPCVHWPRRSRISVDLWTQSA